LQGFCHALLERILHPSGCCGWIRRQDELFSLPSGHGACRVGLGRKKLEARETNHGTHELEPGSLNLEAP
jgi:hypothetical protein